ncbi:MAG: nuclear transport factor 2 family protein [Candidatus Dormibacteraeota bacterium]|nr:nuclear transport factor 2 family protein [Candidatus Dormibacteraeota bacterium]MBV9526369.1 nuclear transport factor 2 family protein [Candidatus Dormibacteraeota bacterium]
MADQNLDAVLDALIQALMDRDLAGTLACLSSRQEPAVIGSEANEVALGRDGVAGFFRRIYARPEPFRFDFPTRSWSVRGDVAWLTADGSVLEPAATEDKAYRLTAVFVVEDGAWKLALWSGSEPADSDSRRD